MSRLTWYLGRHQLHNELELILYKWKVCGLNFHAKNVELYLVVSVLTQIVTIYHNLLLHLISIDSVGPQA